MNITRPILTLVAAMAASLGATTSVSAQHGDLTEVQALRIRVHELEVELLALRLDRARHTLHALQVHRGGSATGRPHGHSKHQEHAAHSKARGLGTKDLHEHLVEVHGPHGSPQDDAHGKAHRHDAKAVHEHVIKLRDLPHKKPNAGQGPHAPHDTKPVKDAVDKVHEHLLELHRQHQRPTHSSPHGAHGTHDAHGAHGGHGQQPVKRRTSRGRPSGV